MLLWPLSSVWLLPAVTSAWNSASTQSQIYTFQEFYSDAQYGPDFGYYSTGRILHADGPADDGDPNSGASQEWFNSYTTLPMSLSPDFANALCDRLASMWQAMGQPSPFVLTEFGGGTGMLARDILRRTRDAHGDFYAAIARYVIAERSQAMRKTQSRTAAEFVAAGKLSVTSADGRQAGLVRAVLEEAVGGQRLTGIVLSNELLDEFDPVRLRIVWRRGRPLPQQRCADCRSYREAHVLHTIDEPALRALLAPVRGAGRGADLAVGPAASPDELAWEGRSLLCGLLDTPALVHAMHAVAEELPPDERRRCAPMLVCCFPFALAVDQALQYHHEALYHYNVLHRHEENGTRDLTRIYMHQLKVTNGTVPLSKERYRELRRLVAARGPEVERALLVGSPQLLPGRIRSHEVFLALNAARCEELRGWMSRNAERLEHVVRLRDGSAAVFNGEPGPLHTAMHLKLVLRPGEAAFVEQAAHLVDEGFLVTMDYGADADALMWQALIRPNYEGIHIMDARHELLEECTTVSYLECPGLQDLTTSVDFTEVAVAGKQLGGWEVLAYGPIFLVELSFDRSGLELAPPGDPYRLGHLVERAGGLRTTGLQAWYRKPEQDPWASFKVLVQHRGGERGADWTLGPFSSEWPLQATPRLFRAPSPCWRRDLTKPPLASLITTAAHRAMGDKAWAIYAVEAATATSPMEAVAMSAGGVADQPDEGPEVHQTLLDQFLAILLGSQQPLAVLLDTQHVAQQQAYADMHLAMVLVDYWRLLHPPDQEVVDLDRAVGEVRGIAASRRLPELYGEPAFDRVLDDLRTAVLGNATLPGPDGHPPYVCMAACALHGRCRAAKSG